MTPRRLVLLGAGILVLLVGAYGASFLVSGNRVPHGVHVAGVDIGDRSKAQAVQLVKAALAERTTLPLTLLAEDVEIPLDPVAAGLELDAEATVVAATSAGPIDRLRALLGTRRDVHPVGIISSAQTEPLLRTAARSFDRPVREGSVRINGLAPEAVPPLAGRSLDVGHSVTAILNSWRAGEQRRIRVPVRTVRPVTTREGVERAVTELAQPALAAPIAVDVEGKPLVVQPRDIAAGLSVTPDDVGAFTAGLDADKVLAALAPHLRAVQQAPVDATFEVKTGKPVLVPSRTGRTIHAEAFRAALLPVLAAPAPRRASVRLEVTEPRVTSNIALTLGIREVIGTFTTYHPCCRPRVQNIHTIADLVNGYVVLPGEVFSLNTVVGKRDAARGFVRAPQILKGQFVDEIGGGVSQFATTIFNAVFFSGLKDVQHTPHSYYISRYPPGRESTVSFPQPDFRFQDDAPTGVLITTSYTPKSVTVTFWGTKRYDITAETGPRTRTRPFKTQYVDRPDCTAAPGAPGFDIVVVRVFHQGGRVVRREPFKTRYLPEPHFVCRHPARGR